MPKSFEKYLAKLPKAWRLKLNDTIEEIKHLRLKDLDVRKLQGFKSLFRCRVGKFRIIFEKKENSGEIIEINTRGDIY